MDITELRKEILERLKSGQYRCQPPPLQQVPIQPPLLRQVPVQPPPIQQVPVQPPPIQQVVNQTRAEVLAALKSRILHTTKLSNISFKNARKPTPKFSANYIRKIVNQLPKTPLETPRYKPANAVEICVRCEQEACICQDKL